MRPRRPSHWTHQTFVAQAALYAEALRSMIPSAGAQVEGIRRILDRARVPPHSRILDLACGIGRHSVPLGSAGYEVVGCDLSPGFIREARARARTEALPRSRARFYVADYRAIARTLRGRREGPFDAAICLFTSMGYHGRQADLAVLREVRRLVRPGGLFILETGDRDSVLRRFEELGVNRYGADLEVHERRRLDRESSTVRSEWTFYRRGPRGHLRCLFGTEITVRLYSLHELKDLFREAGWKYRRAYGSLETLEPVSFDSRRLVIVAQRPETHGR
jgi:SAM-dependent methyltransferase